MTWREPISQAASTRMIWRSDTSVKPLEAGEAGGGAKLGDHVFFSGRILGGQRKPFLERAEIRVECSNLMRQPRLEANGGDEAKIKRILDEERLAGERVLENDLVT